MSDVDSAAPHVADELLLYLDAQRDQMAALGKLPKHLRGVDLLTVADADRLIKFGQHEHCWVGPTGNSKLILDGPDDPRRWRFDTVTGWGLDMAAYLAGERVPEEVRKTRQVRLTSAGRVRAARLKVVAARDTIAKPKPVPPLGVTVVLWEGAEHSQRNVRLARTRTAYLEAHGNVRAAREALKQDGHPIGQSTFYEHLKTLDVECPGWRDSGQRGNPEQRDPAGLAEKRRA